MKVVDLHCDTVLGLLEQEEGSPKKELCIDAEKLRNGEYLLQCFALFTDQKINAIPEIQTMKLMDCYYRMLEENEEILAPVYQYEDIENNRKAGKISTLLTLEDGGVVFSNLAMLRNYYRMGVRLITLIWNYENGIGYPNVASKDFSEYTKVDDEQKVDTIHGLTAFGKAYVKEMERLGIIVDVSHLNDAGFWDVVDISTKPFVASHSNARAICDVARNMSDEMILALKAKGGVMGLNFCSGFLKKNSETSRIEDMVQHILYIRDLAGIDVIALGTDFDGISCDLEIENCSQIQKLKESLIDAGLNQEEIEKIFYKNALRVFQQVL